MRRLLTLFCMLLMARGIGMTARPAAASGPKVDLNLYLGVAEPEPFFQSGQPHGAMGEIKAKVTGKDLMVYCELRDAFYNGGKSQYLGKKSRLKAGFQIPIGSGVALFTEYERAWRTDDSWGWAGIKIDIGRWFH